MNIALWILQILLGIHTAIGAVWKFSNTAEQTMSSLGGIPPQLWLALSVLELICVVGFLIPLINKRFSKFAAYAALAIATEMVVFCVVHLSSGDQNFGPMVYWLVVAALCGLLAYGRMCAKQKG